MLGHPSGVLPALHVPIVDGVPQRIDIDAASACLQRRYFEEVNCDDSRKVHEWRQIRGELGFDNYEPAVYLQAVTFRANRTRLTQFRTGSHWLGVELGRWQRLQHELRHCKRCECGSIDDAAHMIWGCPDLVDQRLQHVELFCDSQHTIEAFLQQEPTELALFLRLLQPVCSAAAPGLKLKQIHIKHIIMLLWHKFSRRAVLLGT